MGVYKLLMAKPSVSPISWSEFVSHKFEIKKKSHQRYCVRSYTTKIPHLVALVGRFQVITLLF